MIRKIMIAIFVVGILVFAQVASRDDVKYIQSQEKQNVSDILDDQVVGNVEIQKNESLNDIRSVPTRMNFQGYLTNSSGAPINGNVPITFSIWDAFSGGNRVWGDEVDTVYCNTGLFNTLIGNKVAINPYVFTAGGYRVLKLKINNQDSVKVVITNTGYAYSCSKSDSSAWAYNSDRLDNYHAGNSSGQIPINNGTMCTNLNSDLLDGLHSSSFLTTSSDYGRSGVASNLYEGSQTLTALYVNENQSNSISSAMIVDGTVSQSDIATDGVGSAEIATGAVTTTEILDGTIQTGDCAFTVGDISGVSAGDGLTGGGTAGSVTLDVGAGTGITVTSDAIGITVPMNLSGSSTSYIIRGYNSSSGAAVLGNSSGGNGIFGQSSGDDGVYGVSNNSSYSGVYGTAYAGGVAGYANGGSGDRHGGLFWSSGGGSAYVGASIGGTNYKIVGTGNVSCVMPTRDGNKILFASEFPEPFFEDFGQSQLINGFCHVELDPLFLDCIKTDTDHPMKVFVQLNDDCKGVYTDVGLTGFYVHELQNGTSNARFTYRVTANRKDTEYLRFPQGFSITEIMRVHDEKVKYNQGGE